MVKNNNVIYTAITNDYDKLLDPIEITPNCDYICFSDNVNIKSKIWDILPLKYKHKLPVLIAKHPKLLPHLYFKDYEFSMWIDGNIKIKKDLTPLFEKVFKDSEFDLGFFEHPEKRTTLTEELAKCIHLKKDDENRMRFQVNSYYKKGFVDLENGLPACYIIFRKHNDLKIIESMEDWWNEVTSQSFRDQLSFSYIAWKNNLHFSYIDSSLFNEFFDRKQHGNYFLNVLKDLFR
jgi:hypothetical protein